MYASQIREVVIIWFLHTKSSLRADSPHWRKLSSYAFVKLKYIKENKKKHHTLIPLLILIHSHQSVSGPNIPTI